MQVCCTASRRCSSGLAADKTTAVGGCKLSLTGDFVRVTKFLVTCVESESRKKAMCVVVVRSTSQMNQKSPRRLSLLASLIVGRPQAIANPNQVKSLTREIERWGSSFVTLATAGSHRRCMHLTSV